MNSKKWGKKRKEMMGMKERKEAAPGRTSWDKSTGAAVSFLSGSPEAGAGLEWWRLEWTHLCRSASAGERRGGSGRPCTAPPSHTAALQSQTGNPWRSCCDLRAAGGQRAASQPSQPAGGPTPGKVDQVPGSERVSLRVSVCECVRERRVLNPSCALQSRL